MRRILTLAVLVTLVAACGGDSSEGIDQTPADTEAPTTAPESTPSTSTTQDVPDTTEATDSTTAAPQSTTTEAADPLTDGVTTTTADPAAAADTTTTTSSTTTTTVPEVEMTPSPLTGLGVASPESLNRRTMAVKVDNHWDARPQAGIGEAEAVFEILVEAGITRFIAFFHTVDSPSVGPVRSVRPTDPHLLRAFNATLLTSGGQDWILRLFPRNGVGVIGEIGVGGYRDDSRSAPHNYFVNTEELRDVADELLYPNTAPPPLFEFGDLPSEATLGAVSQVRMEWAADNVITWRWNGTQWERHLEDGPHRWRTSEGEEDTAPADSEEEATPAEEVGEIITADTLVVLFSGLFYTQPQGGGYALPTMETTGGGRALVFSQGQVVEGRWEREETSQPFVLSLEDGSPITVPPGRPWLSLFPEGRSVTW